jgi:hypothetical protein
MARLVSIKIDLSKIDKSRIFESQKTGAKYLDITGVLTDTPDQYENNGFVKQNTTKEEREAGLKLPIIGNFKLLKILNDPGAPVSAQPIQREVNPIVQSDDLPF